MDGAVGLPFNLYTGTYETSVLTFEKRKKNWQCIKYYKHEPALKTEKIGTARIKRRTAPTKFDV